MSSNVIDMRARLSRPALRLVRKPLKDASAVSRYVRSFMPERPQPIPQVRAALELRAWVERTTNNHGAETTLELLQFQIERVKAQGGANA